MIKYLSIVFTGAVIIAIVLLYFFFDARNGVYFFPKCPFYLFTGLYCPGCGSQRAISALLHGNIMEAASMNILLVLYLPFIMYSGLVHFINAFRKKEPLQKAIFYNPLFVKITLALVLIFWVLRNIPQYPFNLLAPTS